MASPSRNALISFNAGEWTPKLDARVDLKKYQFACRRLENAVVESYGAANRRSGMRYVKETKNVGATRLFDFKFSETTTFAIEFGDAYIRFFSNGLQVVLAIGDVTAWLTSTAYVVGDFRKQGGVIYRCIVAHTSGTFATDLAVNKWFAQSAYEIVSPYAASDVFTLHFQQINDVVFITHPAYAVRKLVRVADTNWTISEVVFDGPALLDENVTTTTITPSATTGSVTLTSSAAIFLAGHVGSYWQLTHDRPASQIEIAITGNGTSSTIPIRGNWDYRTTGTWSATFAIERSYDGGTTWERVIHLVGISENFASTDNVESVREALFRIVIEGYVSGSGRAIISCTSSQVNGLAKVTAFTDTTHVTATVISSFYAATATKVWREGSWSAVRGYPRTVTLYEQRLMFASTSYEALTIWGSVTGDYENFEYGTTDDAALKYTLAGRRYDAIQWLLSHTRLLIGTSGDEWSVSGGAGEEALTPTNIRAVRQSSRGAASVQAIMANDSALFVQRSGKKIREMVFTFEKDGYVTPDLTEFAEHITAGGKIVQIAFQQNPFPVLWAATADGKLLSMSYEREQDIVAWCPHPTQGYVESVCVTPNATTGNDDLWLVVRRSTFNGDENVDVRYVEILQTPTWTEIEDSLYVDCAYSYSGSPTNTVTALWLANRAVSILADGAVLPNQTFAVNGILTLAESYSKIVVGYQYDTVLKPMRLDVDPFIGPTQGQKRRIHELIIRFYRTLGCQFWDGSEKDFVTLADKWRDLSFRDTSNNMDEAPPIFSGDKEIEAFGGWEVQGDILLRQNQPLPWSVLAIIPKYEVSTSGK